MALTAYETQTRQLLQNPTAPTTLYSTTDIDTYINRARGQLAGEAECIRYQAALSTVASQQVYNFSAVNTGNSAINGIQGIIHVRTILLASGSGYIWLTPRSWEWFTQFHLNNTAPVNAQPTTWSQYAQGTAPPGASVGVGSTLGGSIYLDPPPNGVYSLLLDCVCFPVALADNTTVEAIPYLWTDAVPYFAAYLALLSAQMQARRADAEAYFNYYQTFVQRARQFANPDVMRPIYSQAEDPAKINKLGIVSKAGGGAQ